MRGSRPDDAVLVDLDDADDRARGTLRPGADQHPRRRLVWWVGAVVLALLAATVGVANVLQVRRDAARQAAFGGAPWVLPGMAGPLQEAWRIDGTGWAFGETRTGILLQDGRGVVRAVAPASGEVLWGVAAADGFCWLVSAAGPSAAGTDPLDDLLVCDASTRAQGGASDDRLVTYDAGSGEKLAEVSTPGTIIYTGLLDGDDLTVAQLDDGTVAVVLTDLRTGVARWTYTGPSDLSWQVFTGSWDVTHDDDTLAFDGPADLVLSRQTGERVAARPPSASPETWPLPGGGRLVLTDAGLTGTAAGEVREDDGSVRFEFVGYPWTDGVAGGDVLVVQRQGGEAAGETSGGPGLVGLDLATGEELWRRPNGGADSLLLAINGVAVVHRGPVVTAIDLHTGAERWTLRVASTIVREPATDGNVVLLSVVSDGVWQIEAIDLRTGDRRWAMPAPNGLLQLSVGKGLVLMGTGTEIIAYRP